MDPETYVRDGYAPYRDEIRSKLVELRDKIANLGDDGDPEQLARYLRGVGKLIAEGEADNEQRLGVLRQVAQRHPQNLIPVGQAETRTRSSTPTDATRSAALRAVEARSGQLDPKAADQLDRVIRGEPDAPNARYIAAVANPAYASAWRKAMRDPQRAVLEMTDAERAALVEAREAEEFRAMSIGTPSAGGFALPFDLDPTLILTNDSSTNPLRQISRVKQVTQKSSYVVTTSGTTAVFGSEGSTIADTTPTLAQPEVVNHRGTAYIKGSIELFQDWSGIQSELARVFADAKDNLEAEKFLSGTGTNEPEGLLVGLPTSFAAPDAVSEFIDIQNALGARYQPNASWLMNLAAINAVGQLVAAADATNAPILSDGRLLRKPVFEASYMPAGNVVYGDFRQGFIIADRLGMSVELVQHIHDGDGALVGQRGLLAIWRSGCLVINADAFVLGGLGS